MSPSTLPEAVRRAEDAVLLKLIAAAYTHGFGQGMRDQTASRGGDCWPDVKAKYEAALSERLTTLLADARDEGAKAEREACADAAVKASLPDGYRWGSDAMEQFDFGKARAAAAIRTRAAESGQ